MNPFLRGNKILSERFNTPIPAVIQGFVFSGLHVNHLFDFFLFLTLIVFVC